MQRTALAHTDDFDTRRANAGFIKASMRTPLLSREHEFELARRWREERDVAALHEFVRAYTRLVVAIAGRFRNYGLPIGDLVQEGNVGLMQAAARFDPERETRFSTYAAWWIRSAMQDYILRNWSIVRTGTTAAQKSLFFNLRRLRARIADLSGSQMSGEACRQIAGELGVRIVEVEAMELRLGSADQSLNAPVRQDGEAERQDLLVDERASPEEIVIGRRDGAARTRWLVQALDELSPRERRIIRARRLREAGVTLEDLGRELGVSKERVRQLEHRALLKLKAAVTRRAAAGAVAPAG